MKHEIMEVEKERFSLKDSSQYLVQGTWAAEYVPEVFLDKEPVLEIMDSYKDGQMEISIPIPKDAGQYKKLYIYAVKNGRRMLWFSEKMSQISRKQNMPQYFIDYIDVDMEARRCMVSGWAVYQTPLDIYVENENKEKVKCSLERVNRPDVQQQYQEFDVGKERGFFLDIPIEEEKGFRVVFAAGGHRTIRYVSLQKRKMAGEKIGVYYRKGMRYLKLHGAAGFAKKLVKKAEDYKNRPYPYTKWYPEHMALESELEQQRKTTFAYAPLISIVIPLYNTPVPYLKELLDSVQAQTYPNFQLCLADGSDNSRTGDYIRENYGTDKRIQYKLLENNAGISENTNEAIKMATGEFIMFSDHDDTLAPNALFEIVKEMNEHPGTDVVYTDEDKVTMDGKRYFDPHFKPDFNLDMLRCNNYICHIFVVKREILEQVGMLRKEFDGAQDFDFILRCCEKAENIRHVAKILYHWRNHPASTAGNPESKMYAYEAGRNAVQAHYDRIGMKAEVSMTEQWGRYRTKLFVEGEPLVTIIIPNKDHKKELKTCVDSLFEKTSYQNFEILIIENNSTGKEIFAYYKELEAAHENVRVLTWEKEFNYSAINNFGAEHARGEYLLLLNNDIEVKTENWMEEMLSYCQREDVGIVGAKLLFPNEKIQHAGVILGMGPSGTAGHLFYNFPGDQFVYAGRSQTTQDLSAVTAACMMVKKELYQKVGGMDEAFQVAFNDIDFCLRVRETGKLVVFQAYAELYHHESLTRGYETSQKNKKRFKEEIKLFKTRWKDLLEAGDPYYNPNLTLRRSDCTLRE
nr:glycosyltransferase family 2 protein [uncultured Blautia sp.]